MIHEVTMYAATCDNCGKDWEDTNDGFVAFGDESSLTEKIYDDGWHIGDGKEGEKDKCYCDDCWSRDDDDVFHLKTVVKDE